MHLKLTSFTKKTKKNLLPFLSLIICTLAMFFSLPLWAQQFNSRYFNSLAFDAITVVKNNTEKTIDGFTILYSMNAGQMHSYTFACPLPAGKSASVQLPRYFDDNLLSLECWLRKQDGQPLDSLVCIEGVSILFSKKSTINAGTNAEKPADAYIAAALRKQTAALSVLVSAYINDEGALAIHASSDGGYQWITGKASASRAKNIQGIVANTAMKWQSPALIEKAAMNESGNAVFEKPMEIIALATPVPVDDVASTLSKELTNTSGCGELANKITVSPNPFSNNLTVRYTVIADSKVSIVLVDATGKLIATLADNNFEKAGEHSIVFNASQISAGAYFIKAGLNQATYSIRVVKQ